MSCLLTVGCSTTFPGYRKTTMTPYESRLPGERSDAEIEDKALELYSSGSGITAIDTALPFKPAEYRRVYISEHKNTFGDAIHGHYLEVLFNQAEFLEKPKSPIIPTGPVLTNKETLKKLAPPQAKAQTMEDYLKKLGITPDGKQLTP